MATRTKRKLELIEPPAPPSLIKLDIACGQNKNPGFIGMDWTAADGVDIVHDLTVYPWPIEDGSVEQAFCSHYIEHIPMVEVEAHGHTAQDALLAFFDEHGYIPDFSLEKRA